MYSKFSGQERGRPPRPVGGAHMSRTPAGAPSYRQRVRVPPNYSGLAIVDGEERLPGTENAVPDAPPAPTEALPDNRVFGGAFGRAAPPQPRFEDLEQVSELPNRNALPVPATYREAAPRAGGLFDLSHFPFGHGLGTEEWLLIGLIFVLMHEAGPDRGDLDETLILLGILLLGG